MDKTTPPTEDDLNKEFPNHGEEATAEVFTEQVEPEQFVNKTIDIRDPIESIDLTRPNYSDATLEKDPTSETTVDTYSTAIIGVATTEMATINGYEPYTDLPEAGNNLVPNYFGGSGGKNNQSS